jgi:hypothetical protein
MKQRSLDSMRRSAPTSADSPTAPKSSESPLVRALGALEQARDAVREALGSEAPSVTAAQRWQAVAKSVPSARAAVAKPATSVVEERVDVSAGMLRSEVSFEEAEGMFSYMQSSAKGFGEFSVDDFSELAVRDRVRTPRLPDA